MQNVLKIAKNAKNNPQKLSLYDMYNDSHNLIDTKDESKLKHSIPKNNSNIFLSSNDHDKSNN